MSLVILIVVLGMVCLAAVAVGIAVYVMRSNSTPATPATPQQPQDGAWQCATATSFSSYPTSSAEGVGYNGYQYEGQFAGVNNKMSKEWVKSQNIVSVNKPDFKKYKNNLVSIKDPSSGNTITAQVLDLCDDNDTPHKNQCTLNSQKYGCNFLLDIEAYTAKRLFGANTNPDQVEKKVLWQVVGQGRQF